MTKEEEVAAYAYIAGLMDGEGSIMVNRRPSPNSRLGHKYYAYATITNNKIACLEFCLKTFNIGSIRSIVPKKKNYMKSVAPFHHRWEVKFNQVKDVLEKIYPYMIIKRPQVENITEFFKEVNDKHYKNVDVNKQFEHYIKAKQLNGTILTDEKIEEMRPRLREMQQVGEKQKFFTKCKIEGCEGEYHAKEMCAYHYKKQHREKKESLDHAINTSSPL